MDIPDFVGLRFCELQHLLPLINDSYARADQYTRSLLRNQLLSSIVLRVQSGPCEEECAFFSDFMLAIEWTDSADAEAFIHCAAVLLRPSGVQGSVRLLGGIERGRIFFASHAVEWTETVSPLFGVKSSKVRIAALQFVSALLFNNPWRTTYSCLCVLLGRRENENEIAIDRMFERDCNYIAGLVFDAELRVRLAVFDTLVRWVTELQDREDIDRHIGAYVLTAWFDPDVSDAKKQSWRNAIIQSCGGFERWVQKVARYFVPALLRGVTCSVDFQNVTTANRIGLLHVVLHECPGIAAEWVVDIFRLVERILWDARRRSSARSRSRTGSIATNRRGWPKRGEFCRRPLARWRTIPAGANPLSASARRCAIAWRRPSSVPEAIVTVRTSWR